MYTRQDVQLFFYTHILRIEPPPSERAIWNSRNGNMEYDACYGVHILLGIYQGSGFMLDIGIAGVFCIFVFSGIMC
jgi:hypothetical protein